MKLVRLTRFRNRVHEYHCASPLLFCRACFVEEIDLRFCEKECHVPFHDCVSRSDPVTLRRMYDATEEADARFAVHDVDELFSEHAMALFEHHESFHSVFLRELHKVLDANLFHELRDVMPIERAAVYRAVTVYVELHTNFLHGGERTQRELVADHAFDTIFSFWLFPHIDSWLFVVIRGYSWLRDFLFSPPNFFSIFLSASLSDDTIIFLIIPTISLLSTDNSSTTVCLLGETT